MADRQPHQQHPPPPEAASLPCRLHPDVRSAIAIHNIGCALLEAGCHGDAHPTLTDAARAMMSLLGGGDQREGTREGVDDGTRRSVLASMLAAANQRLALPRPETARSSHGGFKRPSPLRIDVEELDEPGCLTVMTAISVHNAGVCCFYRSLEASLKTDVQKYLQTRAIFLLQSSYAIINDSGPSVPTTLTYAVHILESLQLARRFREASWVPCEQGGQDLVRAATAVEGELVRLREMARVFEVADPNIFGRSAFAAAA